MMKVWLFLLAVTAAMSGAYCSDGTCKGGVLMGSWGPPIPVYTFGSSGEATNSEQPLTTIDRSHEVEVSDKATNSEPPLTATDRSLEVEVTDKATNSEQPLTATDRSDKVEVPKTEYLLDEEYEKYLAERMLYYQNNNISESLLNHQYNDTSNETSVTGGRRCYDGKCSSCCGKPNPCDCVPIHPEMKDFQWSVGKHCLNLEANINLLFKEDNYWCRIKTIIKNAVEDALGNRCTLCNRKRCRYC